MTAGRWAILTIAAYTMALFLALAATAGIVFDMAVWHVALRLTGALAAWGGGIIYQGKYRDAKNAERK
jgi:hypothetical protein